MAEEEVGVARCGCVLDICLCVFFRYNELMFLIDTCQAASMFRTFYSPNIVACGSSAVNEDALSVRPGGMGWDGMGWGGSPFSLCKTWWDGMGAPSLSVRPGGMGWDGMEASGWDGVVVAHS